MLHLTKNVVTYDILTEKERELEKKKGHTFTYFCFWTFLLSRVSERKKNQNKPKTPVVVSKKYPYDECSSDKQIFRIK